MENLKRLRRDAGLTQHALAKEAGIHLWRISHAELGILTLAPEEVKSIRKLLADAIRKKLQSLAALTAAP
jgi:transcriptional regulator with XRE-family HTH domain